MVLVFGPVSKMVLHPYFDKNLKVCLMFTAYATDWHLPVVMPTTMLPAEKLWRRFCYNSGHSLTTQPKTLQHMLRQSKNQTQSLCRKKGAKEWQRSSKKHAEADGYPQRAIQGVFENFTALTQTLRVLKEEGDASAPGLLQQVSNIKFLGTVYLLQQVLPALSHLRRSFQGGNVSFAAIEPAIKFTIDEIKDVANQQKPLKQLKKDLVDAR